MAKLHGRHTAAPRRVSSSSFGRKVGRMPQDASAILGRRAGPSGRLLARVSARRKPAVATLSVPAGRWYGRTGKRCTVAPPESFTACGSERGGAARGPPPPPPPPTARDSREGGGF